VLLSIGAVFVGLLREAREGRPHRGGLRGGAQARGKTELHVVVNLCQAATRDEPQSCMTGCVIRHPFAEAVSRDVISYLKLSGSRQSSRPSAVSASGYIKNPMDAPTEPGSATSCAKL
jgi:hypothetical protein